MGLMNQDYLARAVRTMHDEARPLATPEDMQEAYCYTLAFEYSYAGMTRDVPRTRSFQTRRADTVAAVARKFINQFKAAHRGAEPTITHVRVTVRRRRSFLVPVNPDLPGPEGCYDALRRAKHLGDPRLSQSNTTGVKDGV